MNKKINPYSIKITQDESLPAAQAMLYAIGMDENDLKKAQIGIVSTGFQGNPCNVKKENPSPDRLKCLKMNTKPWKKFVQLSCFVREAIAQEMRR